MKWIVIERQDPDFPIIVTDENGVPKIFYDINEANKEVGECQDGVPLRID